MSRRPAPPLPLGFLALAVGTLLLATLNLGWLEPADGHDVAVALVAFVAPLQLTASIMGFVLGEVVPATAMAILAGTWTTVAVVMLTSPPGGTSAALGTALLLSAGALLVAALMAGARGAALPAAVITGAAVRFATTGGYELSGAPYWERAAGWVGLALAALAAVVAAILGVQEARRERRASRRLRPSASPRRHPPCASARRPTTATPRRRRTRPPPRSRPPG